MRTTINEFEEEFARLSLQAERLNDLLTAKIAEEWSGDACDACRRESRDNQELMLKLLDQFKSIPEVTGGKVKNIAELPSDFLL